MAERKPETPLEAIARLRAEIALTSQELDQHQARLVELDSSEDRAAISVKERQIAAAREEINAHFDGILDKGLADNSNTSATATVSS